MSHPLPAPEFEPGGAPPPVRSESWLVDEDFMLLRRQPEPGRDDPARSGWRGLHILLHELPNNEVPAHLDPARAWLEANLGTERLAYAELAPNRRFGRYRPFNLVQTAEAQRIELENDHQMNPLHRERLLAHVWPITLAKVYGHVDLVRVQHRIYWQREDPVQQLSPGMKRKYTSKATVGFTEATANELSTTIGLSVGALTAQLSPKITSTLTRAVQREVSEELELSNDRLDYSRRVAIWRYVHLLRFEYLTRDRAKVQYPQSDLKRKEWHLLDEVAVVDDAQTVTTSADVRIGG